MPRQVFAPSAHVPVRSYGVQDTQHALNTESLWGTCTSSIAGMFASMPLTDEAVNKERVKHAHESTVHLPRIVFEKFDPSLDYAEDRMHSMEILVDELLQRSRALAPHFWNHAHRYVASDSVWCESDGQPVAEPASATTEATFRSRRLRQEQAQAPAADQLLYPADVLGPASAGGATSAAATFPTKSAYARTLYCSARTNKRHHLPPQYVRRCRSPRSLALAPDAVMLAERERERELFIGTQFSILYTFMYSPA
jgi:hypothetical protein